MPLRGGASDKYGNRYEGKWTVYCLAQLMAEEAVSIQLEPPGEEGVGCEFCLKKGEITEYHQVKRQHAKPGGWDTAELFSNKVLKNAFEKTIGKKDKFIFISTDSVGLLDELVDAAIKTDSLDKFCNDFLTSNDKKAEWDKIIKGWQPFILEKYSLASDFPKEEKDKIIQAIAYDHLKRIEIRTIDEESLKEKAETKLRTLFKCSCESVRHSLADYALENIHELLFADDLWTGMIRLGYLRVDYSKDKSVLASIDDCNKRYESLINPIFGNISISRDETDLIKNILLGEGPKRSVLVSGKAGIGKTFVLGETIKDIVSLRIPHLYFRIDRLNPTDLPENIGHQLNLPSSPVEVLGNIAKSRQSILIIDQLDAVSTASGRNPEFFFCVNEIIRQVEYYPNMRLLMACRSFDLEKDNRLRELISDKGPAQQVDVKLFSTDNVKSTLVKLEFSPSDFTEKQIELLRLPLNLSIFAQMKYRPQKAVNAFSTSTDLFKDYWEFKEQAVRKRTGVSASQWTNVIDKLCGVMTENQTLSVHENVVLDDFQETVRAMESENVLVLNDKKISFFHESFFDYAFARRFVANEKDIIEYLKVSGQHLFKRAPLRQVLFHKYDYDHLEFVSDIRCILNDPDIRFHIKKCALELLGQLDYANEEQWNLLKEYIEDSKTILFREVFLVFIRSSSWFKFLYEKKILSEWMNTANEDVHKQSLFIINNQIKYYPKESVELLIPYIGKSPEWNQKISDIISHHALPVDRVVFELFINLLEIGTIDLNNAHTFWSCIYELSKKKPSWGAEALGIYLKKILAKTCVDKIEHKFLNHDGTGEHEILEIARNAPLEYLDNVLPYFLKIVEETAKERDGKLKIDKVWCFRFYREKDPISLEDAILLGLEKALRILSEKNPLHFAKHFDKLSLYGNYDSVNFLLIRALTVSAPQFADHAVKYILENPQRLESAWSGGGSGDFSHWAAYELIKHISQLCSNELYLQLENCLLSYYPKWELSENGYKSRGYWQCIVLPALDSNHRTEKVKARIGEWQRKYPGAVITPPVESGAIRVPSPIPEDKASKMTDSQWIKAIERYDDEERHEWGKGGPGQLSEVLEAETKKNPSRFAKLAFVFDESVHPYYFQAVLRGLRESEVCSEMAFGVIRKIHSVKDKPGDRWICSFITKFKDDNIPDDIIHILGWLATRSDNPKENESKVRFKENNDEARQFNLETDAINCVRGCAAESIGSLLFDHPERLKLFVPYIEIMVNDPSTAVRTTVPNALLALYTHDKAKAVDLFIRLCNINDDYLLATHHVDRFIYYASFCYLDKLKPLLRRMLDSKSSSVRESGARHVALAQFNSSDIKEMVVECIKGDDAKRKGLAEIASTNVLTKKCRDFSIMILKQFFNDPVKEIRDIAARCLRNTGKRDLKSCRELIIEFIKSEAFQENIDDLIFTFRDSTADISEEIIKICEAIIVLFEKGQIKPGDKVYYIVEQIAELIVRSYRQSNKEEYKERCLDMIDKLLVINAYGIDRELEKYER